MTDAAHTFGLFQLAAAFEGVRQQCREWKFRATKCATPEIAMRLLGHSNISMTLRVYRRGIERVQSLQLT